MSENALRFSAGNIIFTQIQKLKHYLIVLQKWLHFTFILVEILRFALWLIDIIFIFINT
jgi:hypothetical protein